ncbi:MAG TPA: hypothetical protein VF559_03880 [Caulobacteraceae bacterium]|jgi:Ca2+-binding RTX toxin-like protein
MAKIEGNDNNNRLVGTDAGDEIRGRGGDDQLIGRGGNDRLRGDKGNDTLDGGSGNDRLRGDHGNDVLTGGSGSDRFIFNRQGGTDRVTDFQDGVDKLDFTNFGLTPQQIINHADQVGDDVVITLDTGEVVRLEGFDKSQLDSSDFFVGA